VFAPTVKKNNLKLGLK